jgi:hypothetical protein
VKANACACWRYAGTKAGYHVFITQKQASEKANVRDSGRLPKLKPVIIFSSLRDRPQRKLAPASAGGVPELEPEIIVYAATDQPLKPRTRF